MGDDLSSDLTRGSRADFPFSRPGRTSLCLTISLAGRYLVISKISSCLCKSSFIPLRTLMVRYIGQIMFMQCLGPGLLYPWLYVPYFNTIRRYFCRDDDNDWVQIGLDNDGLGGRLCTKHNAVYNSPSWGTTVSNLHLLKGNLFCCSELHLSH